VSLAGLSLQGQVFPPARSASFRRSVFGSQHTTVGSVNRAALRGCPQLGQRCPTMGRPVWGYNSRIATSSTSEACREFRPEFRFAQNRIVFRLSLAYVRGQRTMEVSKRVVLGVTGSIAAHKAADLTSLLQKTGYQVNVVMTRDALRFITPIPFQTLSRNPVVTDLYDEEDGWKPLHIRLADEADLLVVAPATAHTLAKLAHGFADDALSCIALALNARARLLLAPAMNGKMWQHAATRQNVQVLKERGAEFVGPDEGLLSCGYEGIGRLWPVERIADRINELLQ